ncbi:MAG TPA: hypothetical protein VMS08_05880 [Candidatus Saccharimonadia bacterium]|nr:hypothetical protein [Candidatus Saccharimonadia bacterium]
MNTQPQFILQDGEPLFPNILFNRPITRHAAGRMLLVGGYATQFSLPTSIHQLAVASGIGECRVVLPDNLAKILSGAPGTYFVASSPSGSLGREALGRILELSEDADAVAIGASLSNNSDTAMLTERLLGEIGRPLILFEDALKAAQHNVTQITDNPSALVILTMAEAFKLCGKLSVPIQIRAHAGLINKLEIIQDLKAASRCQYVVFGTEIIVASDTRFIVTPINYRLALNPAIFYATLGTFWLQNPTDPRAGLATAAYLIRQATDRLGATDRPSTADLAGALERVMRQDDF